MERSADGAVAARFRMPLGSCGRISRTCGVTNREWARGERRFDLAAGYILLNPGRPSPLGVRRFGPPRLITFSEEEWAAHLASDEQLRQQIVQLERRVAQLEQRATPPPEWAKPNVPERSEEERKKRGAVEGHEAHHRPPPSRIDETQDVPLEQCPRCGEGLGEPFAIDERVVEAIVPGHARGSHSQHIPWVLYWRAKVTEGASASCEWASRVA